ncbi:hypothetical protein [Streptomyces zingiberis]|uniref:Uncharacterized protein n=1 Tax=Streptomyces zingiberis TaxID=2053010 RepID=A0ABX1C7S2_9ACTN|nr:hypothetical protein [Streptomyces zingiberis]NJQ03004.1 hypothetical protein [Streptomyces zingiberis]
MNATATRARRRSASRTADTTARQEAAAALQRALDRRDNGGATGHGR